MSVAGWFMGKGKTGFGYNSSAEEVTEGVDLKGKNFLVTGTSSGLGLEAARVLAMRGAKVLGTARSADKAKAAFAGLPGDFVPVACELSEPSSVREAVAAVRAMDLPIHGLIANAGVMAIPQRQLKHGYEEQWFTNHVGHFLLVTGLLDRLADDGRVVMLASSAHENTYPEGVRLDDLKAERSYSGWQAYGQSKLSNILFARHLSKHLPKPAQTANSVHPGVIPTNLVRHLNPALRVAWAAAGPLVLKNIPQGAATEVYVAANPAAGAVNGEYWADCNVATSSAWGRDDGLAAALWKRTEEIVATL